MNYFTQDEFRQWYDLMSPRLIAMLDVFRHIIDRPVNISLYDEDDGSSLGRRWGMQSKSAHNIDYWGECLAADFFVGGVYTTKDAREIVRAAEKLGFTGIGVYPQWTNNQGEKQVGFHLDVRPTKKMGDPSKWGFVNGKMININTALEAIDNV